LGTELDFQLLFEESPDVLLVLLPDAPRYTMVAASKARWRATHTGPATLGRGLFEVFPDNPDDLAATGTSKLRASLERVRISRQPDTMPVQQYDIRRPDGSFEPRYWSPKNLPILSASGEVLYILHRVEDVTELVHASKLGEELRGRQNAMEREVLQRSHELASALEQIRDAHSRLAELDIAKTTFFNNVSHEFRTPLTLLLGPLEDELRERAEPLPPERRERVQTAHRNALRLLKMVNGLLEFARIEAGRMDTTYQPTNLSELTTELVSSFESATARAGLRLTIDCPPLPQPIYVDREMWEKIVLNLVSNAFKHTFVGGITVRLTWLGESVELTVEDTGIGISAADLPRVFDRFRRIKQAAARTHEGTGIGLSLVCELVQVHGGSVRVESDFSRGSRFFVVLKAGAAHLPPEQVGAGDPDVADRRETTAYVQEALSWLPSESDADPIPVPPEHQGHQPRLLLADDNVDMRRYIARLLQPHYQVMAVPDGQAALEAVRAFRPDLVLSDVTMPRLDGLQLLRALRTDEHTRQLPIILLSARAGVEAAVKGLDTGADDYLIKPFSGPELLARVRAHLDLARRRIELERELEERVKLRTAEVTRLTRVLQMLSGINAALLRIQDRDHVMSEACRLAQVVGGYRLAMVALVEPTTRMARPVGWAGSDFLAAPNADFLIADRESADTSLMGRVIRTGEPVLCADVEQFPYVIDHRRELLAAGIQSLACIPLKVDGTSIGALLFGSGANDVIGLDQMVLLEEVAANLAFALQYLNQHDAVQFLSYFEPLTGLANRALFCERLARLLNRGVQSLPRLGITVFDIAHLAVINDSLGRHSGDRLLQLIADRLKARFPDSEQLADLGGGTFVCLRAIDERSDSDTLTTYDDLTRLFAAPFNIDGQQIVTEIKCGVACYPDDGADANGLVQNAESALKVAKASGERYLHHRIEMNSELARRVALERRLRRALEDGQFSLYYQPKISLLTGEVAGAEALLRWQDPEHGLISPAEFLPLLESGGLMHATGAWVVRQAVADCHNWRRRGLPPIRLAVNMSPSELRRRNVASDVLDAVDDLAGSASWGIDIEITEGALAGDAAPCIHALRLLRAAGLRIAIDDFGTGFSSLARLSELPIDTLKIDQTFTSRLSTDPNCGTLVSTIISLAHAFEMTTVAEGVETREQLEHLQLLGCDESQGFLHCRPLPKADFEKWFSKAARGFSQGFQAQRK
jgi:diguanylate cyclase (GGDEF)-like protein